MGTIDDTTRLLVVGANHRSSTAGLRDRLLLDEAKQRRALEALRGAGMREAIVLSTCARTEIQAAADDPMAAGEAVARLLAETSRISADELAPQLYRLTGDAALRHMFLVVASLDSPVIGEPEVTGQVKASHAFAKDLGMTGKLLEPALQAGYRVAKRVRSETGIGERPVSIAAAAVQIARDVHGDLARCTGLLVAGGEMGEIIIGQLAAAGLRRISCIAPVPARAEMTARRIGGNYAAMDELTALLERADIVVSALGSGRQTNDREAMERALKARRRRPVYLVDAGIPWDVAPEVNELDGAFLYDLGDLERIAMSGVRHRDSEAAAARVIVDEEVAAFLRRGLSREAAPLVTELRDHFDAVRRSVLDEAGRADPDRVTELLIARLLHAPSERLRQLAEEGTMPMEELQALIRRLFALDEDGGGGGKSSE